MQATTTMPMPPPPPQTAVEQQRLVSAARRHPHWRTLCLTAAWLEAGQAAVEDIATAVSGGHVGRTLAVTGLPARTLLFDPDAGAFAAIAAAPAADDDCGRPSLS